MDIKCPNPTDNFADLFAQACADLALDPNVPFAAEQVDQVCQRITQLSVIPVLPREDDE